MVLCYFLYLKNRIYFNSVKWLFLLTLILFPFYSRSQIGDYNVNKDQFIQMKSPNVAIMDRFDTFKVNYFNGLPEISIPLYEIKTSAFTIPIELQYHSSGVKVADIASWVGLGWNLTGQFQMSRSVKGSPDEGSFLKPNFNFSTSNNVVPSTQAGYYNLNLMMPAGDRLFPGNDSEPDVFHYKLLNKRGSIRYKKNAIPFTIPYDPISIQTRFQSETNFLGFKLTDQDGLKYTFGQSNDGLRNSFERTTSSESGRSGMFVSSWLLTDLVSPQKQDSIQYEYYPREDVTTFSGFGVNITVLDNYSGSNIPQASYHITNPYKGSSVEQQFLKTVFFENGKIDYILSSQNRLDLKSKHLSEVNVYSKVNNSYQLIKKVKFNFSYFLSDDTGRLRLDNIEVMSNSNDKQTYRFEYDNTFVLPKTTSLGMDSWGYFNNQKHNTTGIPDTSIAYSGTHPYLLKIGDNTNGRLTDTIAVQAGVLKKIIYPTGGFTTFLYESNRISHLSKNLIAGGLRIKQIKSYSSLTSIPLVRTFKYGKSQGDESGLGYVNVNTQFNYLPSTLSGEYYNKPSGTNSSQKLYSYKIRVFSNYMTYNQNDYDNSNAYYPFVTEYIGDENNNIGKNTYLYSNAADLIVTDFMVVRPVAISSHWLRGKLVEKNIYNKINNIFNLIQSQKNVFSKVNEEVHPNVGLLVGSVVSKTGNLSESDNYQDYTYPYKSAFYGLTSSSYLPVYSQKIDYPSLNVAVLSDISYRYNGDSNISETKETTSKGDTIFIYSKYASDYLNTLGSSNFLNTLKQLNIRNEVIEQYAGIRKKGGVKPLITSALLRIYKAEQPVLKEMLKLETNTGLSNFQESTFTNNTFISDSRYKKHIEFPLYNKNNKPTEIHKIDGRTISYDWGSYANGPVAEIINAKSGIEVENRNTSTKNLSFQTLAGSSSEFTFEVGYSGNAKLTMLKGAFLSSSTTLYVDYKLLGPSNNSGSICMNNNSSSACYSELASANSVVFANLLPGTYTLKLSTQTSIPNSSVGLTFIYPTEITYSTGGKEFFYQGFEESVDLLNGNSHAGRGCFMGDYTLYFNPPIGRKYYVDYYYRLANKWYFSKKEFTPNMILNEGEAIDEIRVYPTDSQMSTYTYDPLIGMTSKTDARGVTEYYEYDGMQRLKAVLDQVKNVTSSMDYHYRPN